MGQPKDGFIVASAFAVLLFAGLFLNWIFDPIRDLLAKIEETGYRELMQTRGSRLVRNALEQAGSEIAVTPRNRTQRWLPCRQYNKRVTLDQVQPVVDQPNEILH